MSQDPILGDFDIVTISDMNFCQISTFVTVTISDKYCSTKIPGGRSINYRVKLKMHWNWLKIGSWDPQTPYAYVNAVYLVSLDPVSPYPKIG